jgi:hypothetical protein
MVNNNKGRVIICTGFEDKEALRVYIKEAGLNPCEAIERTVVKFHICRKAFYEFLAPFGRYCHGKVVPRCVYDLSLIKLRCFLRGYFDADGSEDEYGWRATTVSPMLAHGIFTLIPKAYGVCPGIRESVPSRESVTIEGRVCQERPQFVVSVPNMNRCNFVDKYGWRQTKSVKAVPQRELVYQLEVEGRYYVVQGYLARSY